MKKIYFVLTMLAVLVLASCSKKQGAKLVPEDAIVVARMDLTQMMEKTGMKGDDSSLKQWVSKAIKDAGLDKEVREKILEIVDDPTATGIDFTEPVYAYFALEGDRETFGIVGSVASKDDITDLLDMIADQTRDLAVEEYSDGGVKYLQMDRSSAFIYNSDWFYIGAVQRDEDYDPDMDATIDALLERADGKGSIEGNPAFEKMCEHQGLLQVGLFGSGIDAIKGSQELAKYLPDNLELKDIAAMMELAVNDGEILATAEPLPVSTDWQEYIDKQMSTLKDIEEAQAKYICDNGIVAFVNISTKNLYNRIKHYANSLGMSRSDKQQLEELKPLIDAFEGWASLEVSGWSDETMPPMKAYVGTKDRSVVDMVMAMQEDSALVAEQEQYIIPIDYDYDFDYDTGEYVKIPTQFAALGWKNKATYLLLNCDDEPFKTSGHKFSKSDIKGVGAYARISGKFVADALRASEPYDDQLWDAIEKLFDYAELYADNGAKLVARIAMNKKDKSPIVAIAEYVKKYLR